MDDFDRSFLMGRSATAGSSLERLVNMAHDGNENNLTPMVDMKLPKSEDYDMAGYIDKYGLPDQSKGQHLTDEFKAPNHITFSDQSKYSTPETQGGKWVQPDVTNKWHFYASDHNLKTHSASELADYFRRQEPDSVLHLPKAR
jgi:hypothetical protein